MFHEVTVNALGGFIGGLSVAAITSLFTRAPKATPGTQAHYNHSTHVGDVSTHNTTHNERVTVTPTIIQKAVPPAQSSSSSSYKSGPGDEQVWLLGGASLVAVAFYANHQQTLLTTLGNAYAAALAFLLGCLTYMLMTKVRLDARMWFQSAIAAASTAALWFVPHLTRTAPWGGNARDAVTTLRKVGVGKAFTTDTSLIIFPLAQLLGLFLAVLAMLATLRFALSLLASCRLARMLARGKEVPRTVKLLERMGSTGRSAWMAACMTVASLLITSGGAWTGMTWLGNSAQNALLTMTASATPAGTSHTKVCLTTESKVGLPLDKSYTLQTRDNSTWKSIGDVTYSTTRPASNCLTVSTPAGTELRWTDVLQQRSSNVVGAR